MANRTHQYTIRLSQLLSAAKCKNVCAAIKKVLQHRRCPRLKLFQQLSGIETTFRKHVISFTESLLNRSMQTNKLVSWVMSPCARGKQLTMTWLLKLPQHAANVISPIRQNVAELGIRPFPQRLQWLRRNRTRYSLRSEGQDRHLQSRSSSQESFIDLESAREDLRAAYIKLNLWVNLACRSTISAVIAVTSVMKGGCLIRLSAHLDMRFRYFCGCIKRVE